MSRDPIAIWRLVAHHAAPDDALRWFERTNIIAIGWGRIGDVRRYASVRDLSDAIRADPQGLNNWGSGGVCLHEFCHGIAAGDLVIVSVLGQRRLVMEVEGAYEFKPKPEPAPLGDYQHQRRAKAVKIDPDALWREAGARPVVGHSIRWPLIKCRQPASAGTPPRRLMRTDRTP